jgi:mono/diheme cytochrome c family protein
MPNPLTMPMPMPTASAACRHRSRRRAAGLAIAVVMLSCTVAGAQRDPRVQRGQQFAETNCAMCHAVGRFGDSPLAIAPPFRTLSLRYPVEDLEEALAEGVVTGHPTMPQFQLDAAQIADFIAYLKTLER